MNLLHLFSDIDGYKRKLVVTKDSWGNDIFLIKGSLPAEIKELKIPEFEFKTQADAKEILSGTLSSFIKNKLEYKHYVPVTPRIKTEITNDEKICDLILFKTGNQKLYVRKVFCDAISKYIKGNIKYKMYPTPEKYQQGHFKTIVATVQNKPVAIVMPMLIPPEVEIVSPIEALRKIFERTKKK